MRLAVRWVIALAFALTAAATSDFGPVLVHLPGYHGVHVGDLLVFVMAAVWVVLGDPQRNRHRSAEDRD